MQARTGAGRAAGRVNYRAYRPCGPQLSAVRNARAAVTPAAVEAPASTDAWQSFAEHVSGAFRRLSESNPCIRSTPASAFWPICNQQQSFWLSALRRAFTLAAPAGEWEGITATFSPAGQPQPLPEHYVPGAFREWGVELWDWQSQCSCLAVPEGGPDSASTDSRRLRCVWQLCVGQGGKCCAAWEDWWGCVQRLCKLCWHR
jgi:hypothetical protein